MASAQLLKLLRSLAQGRHNQRKSPYFVVEGLRCCREAIRLRPEWLCYSVISDEIDGSDAAMEFFTLSETAGVTPQSMGARDFAAVSCTDSPQGVLCVMSKPEATAPAFLPRPCTLILDQVREPGNFGTILRTAWATGVKSVWTTAGSADPWSPKVIRSGMGAQFAVQVHQFSTLEDAVARHRELGGGDVWCAMMSADTTLFSPEFTPAGGAVIMGNEANGVSHPEVGKAVTIPMPGDAESLNVAQAATLLLYEALRRS
jgi:TrmH family RNA methyltransferase